MEFPTWNEVKVTEYILTGNSELSVLLSVRPSVRNLIRLLSVLWGWHAWGLREDLAIRGEQNAWRKIKETSLSRRVKQEPRKASAFTG